MTKLRTRQSGKTPLRPPGQPPDWMYEPEGTVRGGLLARLCLGALPRRVASYACAVFDVDDAREYRGDDGVKAQGRHLAGLAAQIVRHAKDPAGYLQALKNIPTNIIAPLKTYLRVRLALGRLEAEIAGATPPLSSRPSEARAGVTEVKKPPTFTYHTSPAKTYAFKEITAELGYDPRGTSVYWIERRANRLRRRWKAYHKEQSGERKPPVSKPVTAKVKPPEGPQKIRHFEPPEADYNSVWPPVELPKGPPKLAITDQFSPPPPLSSRTRCGTSPVQANVEENGTDKCVLPIDISSKRIRLSTPETLTRSRIFSCENSGMTGVGGALVSGKTAESIKSHHGDENECTDLSCPPPSYLPCKAKPTTPPPLSSRNCEAISGTSPVQANVEECRADKCDVTINISSKRTRPYTPETLTRSRIFSRENSGMTGGGVASNDGGET